MKEVFIVVGTADLIGCVFDVYSNQSEAMKVAVELNTGMDKVCYKVIQRDLIKGA